MESEDVNWLPLESNPGVINNFIKDLGFDVSEYHLVDVLSTEEWAQQMVPDPTLAVFFLYPVSKLQKEYKKQEDENIQANGQVVSPNVFFMKQKAKNACGTVAMFHAIGNIRLSYRDLIKKDSSLDKFFESTKGLTPEEVGNSLKKEKTVEKAHKEAVHKGETQVSSRVNTHFVAFVEVDGCLYELDGGKSAPINHGKCRSNELLSKACNVIQQFMHRDPTEMRFTIMSLSNANQNRQLDFF